MLYEYPDLTPNLEGHVDKTVEIAKFQKKSALLGNLIEKSNTTLYMPGDGIMRFLLPQSHTRYQVIDIPILHERVANGKFVFNDSVWDELEEVMMANEEDQDAADAIVTYIGVPQSSCQKHVAVRIGTTFVDSEDRVNYKIHEVCRPADSGEEGTLFYKYYNVDTHVDSAPESAEDFEYTPCDELLSADWVTWASDKEDWVQCTKCSKWRRMPKRDSTDFPLRPLDANWSCEMSSWDTERNNCNAPEEDYSQTTSVYLEVDGVPVPVGAYGAHGHGQSVEQVSVERGVINDVGVVSNEEGNPPRGQLRQRDDGSQELGKYGELVDLHDVIKMVMRTLKNHPGSRIFTQFDSTTTESFLS